MNRKQLILLVVAGAILGAIGWGIYIKRNGDESPDQQGGRKVVKNFPFNDVERMVIRQSPAQVTLGKKNEIWTVQERNDYPANFTSISDFLRKVWELKVAQPMEVGQSQLGRLELLPPEKGANSGTLVEFKDKSGKAINSLLLGKKHMRKGGDDSGMPGGGGWPDGRYVMVGDDVKSVAVVSEAFSNIEPKPEEWLNKDFFKVENLRSISITSTNATNNWKIEREKELGEWKLADAKPGEQLDSSKSGSVSSALSSPSFNDVATNTAPDKTGLDKPLLAKLSTFDGFNYEVKVGNKGADDSYFLQMSVTGSFAKDRTAGKDEKPEDKTRLDKEFKEKTQKLEDKLKAEKDYEKWTYVVSKWTIDPLLKERKDLLAEKKEEPKTDASTSSSNATPSNPLLPAPLKIKPASTPPTTTAPVKATNAPAATATPSAPSAPK